MFNTLLSDAQKSLARIKHKQMESYGLESSHAVCMYMLRENPSGFTKAELARNCKVDKAQITRVINDLLEKNYVFVFPAERSYKQKYCLTPKGEEITEDMRSIATETVRYVGGDIPKDQIDNFYKTFQTICDNLSKAEKNF